MAKMTDHDTDITQVDAIFTWLAGEPDGDLSIDLAGLRAQFGKFSRLGTKGPRIGRCLGLFCVRAIDLCGRVEARLVPAALPLESALYATAVGLVDVLLDIAANCQRRRDEVRTRWTRTRMDSEGWNAQALHLVGRAYLLGCMAGMVAPPGLWHWAHALHLVASRSKAEAEPVRGAVFHYKRLLSMAVVQPESLTARELLWLYEYLETMLGDVALAMVPVESHNVSYWIDIDQDRPPMAIARQVPPDDSHIWYFSPTGIAESVAVQIEKLEDRIMEAEVVGIERHDDLLDSEVTGLPEGLAPLEALSLLRRLRERWAEPVMRKKERRECHETVQVCIGLRAVWELGNRGTGTNDSAQLISPFSEWVAFNKCGDGYALVSSGRVESVLSPGVVLVLRNDETQPWTVSVVRWVRSGNPSKVEIGVQVVGRSFNPVRVIFQNSEIRNPHLGLILPPMVGLRQSEAILAPAGVCLSRDFVMVHEQKHLYIAQGRVLQREMQTPAVEVFQYEVDPYPI